ncbi:Complex 1 LYR protein [Plasmopara halstedii]|uniref:Complex 1 LYR protein n=1 Tax=Plasmopara halstedii TaxID=4781 RepID=A0A0P1ABD7_PLAHL|nr:Complex 1 LYR protein [Plasmopara halstedii]CEG37718.1 Complex 1 LYR protein [Plasmopara halstedii]|eukprot:XP_024574087.1 Complex 1 LYR protein [Plasmopara halstedii]
MRHPVLQLYAQCLRSARRCPQWEQREMMKTYVRMKFRDEVNTQNLDRVQTLLADGWEELNRMNYYHSIYEAKQREQTTPSVAGPAVVSKSQRPFICLKCQATYSSEQANFCANCGTKRPTDETHQYRQF